MSIEKRRMAIMGHANGMDQRRIAMNIFERKP
jgi:hypothetical protein